MAQRKADTHRQTKETDIKLQLNLDGAGKYDIDTAVGFLDHMLSHLSRHSGIDITLKAKGDLEVDPHHTVEDVGICLGQCLVEALGEKKGITRFGFASVPMEDALANVSIDLSGRGNCVYKVDYKSEKIGDFDVECLEELLRSFSNNGRFNLHVNVPYGTNSHHIAEAVFKALARALGQAVSQGGTVKIASSDIPSTKGQL